MRLKSLVAALALTCALAGPSSAQQPPPPATQAPEQTAAGDDQDDGANAAGGGRRGRGALAACRSDVRALCGGIEGGKRKERIACLKQNESKLSPDCSAAIQRVVEKRARGENGERGGKRADREGRGAKDQRGGGQGRLAACRGDLASLCASAEAGNGGRVKCLRENASKLSPECGQAIQNVRDGRKQLRQACATERETLCAKNEAGSGGFAGCLRQNAERLSEACSAALAAIPGGKGRRAGRMDPTSGALPSDKR